MQNLLNSLNAVVWGPPMLLFFIFTALRFTVRSRFFQLRGVGAIFKSTFGKMLSGKKTSGISQFSAFCSVLGACIGTGNIVGVATAIYSGGAGAVFWMWLSALLSTMTAYGENYLGISVKERYKSTLLQGAYAYIKKATSSDRVTFAYAMLSFMSAIGMGNLTQSNSLSDSLKNSLGISPQITGIICATLCGLVIAGGIKRIARMQTVLVPLMSIFYLVLSFAVLMKFKWNIVPCLGLILKEAFTVKALSGYGMYKAIRYGVSRGVFSNEAGLGSSTLIHAEADDGTPQVQGMWAMTEVFVDTIFMCTLTALVILVSTDYPQHTLFGSALSTAAYGTIGNVGKCGVGILTAVFAFTSLTSCSFYGEKSFRFMLGERWVPLYRCLYTLLVFWGCTGKPTIIWTIADVCNGLMALPNLFAINCLCKEVVYDKAKLTKQRKYPTA